MTGTANSRYLFRDGLLYEEPDDDRLARGLRPGRLLGPLLALALLLVHDLLQHHEGQEKAK